MPTILVNPLDETRMQRQTEAARLDTLAGKTIGLLDISKPGGSDYLDRIEELLRERFNVDSFFRTTKLTFMRMAHNELIDEIVGRKCDAVIEALAD